VNGDHGPALRAKAKALSAAGRTKDALGVARRAVKADPSDDEAWLVKAGLEFECGRPAEAGKSLGQAL